MAVWAEGLNDAQYLALCGADRIWLPETGTLFLLGLRTERFFLRDLLDRVGARAEVVHIGRYKSAGDTFTRDSMSDDERDQVESWQRDVFAELVSGISLGRELDEVSVRALIDRGPFPAQAAVDAGLVDGLAYPDEISRLLEDWNLQEPESANGARRLHRIEVHPYFVGHVADSGPI
ncbi:MAG: S49 family peptidase, partial [Planctomycetes bacterium]|nr:S49 family peptidase [Planctomycetota bacterium]